jgi:uncharacterized membrane protein YjgN (DUF898 family)
VADREGRLADEEALGEPQDAFAFDGTWRDYLPIALSNLALAIVTVGIYRFWAKARERRYLWRHTRFLDDRLEWTGTGREMFVGFLLVMLLLAGPLLLLRFGTQALILRGHVVAGVLLVVCLYFFLLYMGGFARFRALRYRLGRSYWHGIRGGADDPGFRYGRSALWKPIVAVLPLGLFIPWSMASLWNERWNAMSFGSYRVSADAQWGRLMLRWLLLLATPVLFVIVLGLVAAGVVAMGLASLPTVQSDPAAFGVLLVAVVAFVLGFYALIAIIGLGYYAAFFREAIGALRLDDLQFEFDARSRQWLWLFLGDIALVVLTLGIGICFLGYRHWSFLIRHLGARGALDTATLAQSTTRAPREAEGLADAFDIGAF